MQKCSIKVHEPEFSPHEILINPTLFPDLKLNDLVQIHQPHLDLKNSLYLKIVFLETTKGINEVSIQKNIANIFKIDTSKPIQIQKIVDLAPIDHLEMVIKDQFVPGGQVWFFNDKLLGQTCYFRKSFSHLGVVANVLKMLKDGIEYKSGHIDVNTKITFRSRSGYVYWLFQMSREMWEYSYNGDLHFEKSINFVTELYTRWKKIDVHHKLNIIFFARFYEKSLSDLDGFLELKGRKYSDFYKCFSVETEITPLETLLILLKKEFIKFPKHIDLEIQDKMENSSASEGNCLEAMHLVFDEYDKQHISRNMTKTGFFMTVISAGCGLITINNPDLAHLTQHRIGTNEMTVDFICLVDPPLHGVPILRYRDEEEDHFIFAYWLDIVFYSSEKTNDSTMPARVSMERDRTIRVFNFQDDPVDENVFVVKLQSFDKKRRSLVKNTIKKSLSEEEIGSPERRSSPKNELQHSQSFSSRLHLRDKVKSDHNELMVCAL